MEKNIIKSHSNEKRLNYAEMILSLVLADKNIKFFSEDPGKNFFHKIKF